MTRPIIILVEPQLAENIGMVARAMANFSLSELRLVSPRNGWPKKGAHSAASGATHILEAAKLYDTAREAIADLNYVFATTARARGQRKRGGGPGAAPAPAHGAGAARGAIADLNYVFATTARERGQMKRVFGPEAAMALAQERIAAGAGVAPPPAPRARRPV